MGETSVAEVVAPSATSAATGDGLSLSISLAEADLGQATIETSLKTREGDGEGAMGCDCATSATLKEGAALGAAPSSSVVRDRARATG